MTKNKKDPNMSPIKQNNLETVNINANHTYFTRSKGNVVQTKQVSSDTNVPKALAKRTRKVEPVESSKIATKSRRPKEMVLELDAGQILSQLIGPSIINSLVKAANKSKKSSNKLSTKSLEELNDEETVVNDVSEEDLDNDSGSEAEDSCEEDSCSDSDDDYLSDIEDLPEEIDYTYDEHKYVKSLPLETQKSIVEQEKHLLKETKSNVPLRFRILENTSLSINNKSNILHKIDQLNSLEPGDNEYVKLMGWCNTIDKLPFGKYITNSVSKTQPISEIKEYFLGVRKTLDAAVYGHDVAKTQIMAILAKEIANPNSMGHVFAIKGPMGNGKTTLVKEGICKALNRPFAFIALGGSTDSSYFLGHEFTYEGSKAGKIVEILTETKCMNPVIYFDELDKVSETSKGQEIYNLLCHLTDPAQNKHFHDKYFSGLDFDLSRATLIFSYNDESKINPILLDRMTKIHTDGFDTSSKTVIAKDYLIPNMLNEYSFDKSEIVFEEEAIKKIINNYCGGEQGVRNLKRNIEAIVSKLNIYRYVEPSKETNTNKLVNFKIKDFQLPYTITSENLDSFLDLGKQKDESWLNMYM